MSRQAYPQYKPSGMDWVGDVPKHWEVHRIKHVASVQFSSVDKHTIEGEEPVRLCNYVDVYYNDFIKEGLEFMSATATRSEIARFQLRHGDVLVTKDSESWDDIAVPAYVAQDLDCVLCGYHLAHIRPDLQKLIGEYLFRAFRSCGINDQFRVAANGITRFGLGKYWLDNGLFPVPPLEEQRTIAAFLDRETARIDALIEKKQRQIELLQEKRTALISHAVTKGLDPNVQMKDSGIEWLGEIPEHWKTIPLKRTFAIRNGSTPKSSEPAYWDGEIPWATPDDLGDLKGNTLDTTNRMITQEGYDSCGTSLAPAGSLVLSTRAPIGHLAVAGVSLCTNQGCRCLVFRNTDDHRFYYYQVLAAKGELESWGQGSTFRELSRDKLCAVRLLRPPSSEQRAIVTFLDRETARIDGLITKVRDSIEMLREYRTALISAAVTGKIDVREEIQEQ